MQEAASRGIPFVVDADGLEAFKSPLSFKNKPTALLTPNVAEFSRLLQFHKIPDNGKALENLALTLNCWIFLKGPVDLLSNGNETFRFDEINGSPRRVGTSIDFTVRRPR
jgi:NAD(P)H-hydrate repair Nnr-like enzyme with NAD(P)H-hydrate dehydratase domain